MVVFRQGGCIREKIQAKVVILVVVLGHSCCFRTKVVVLKVVVRAKGLFG